MKPLLALVTISFVALLPSLADKVEVLFDGSNLDAFEYQQGGFEIQLMDNEGFQKHKGVVLEDRKLNGSFYDGKAPPPIPPTPSASGTPSN